MALGIFIGYRCYQRQAVRRNAEAITRAPDADFVLDDRRAEMGEAGNSAAFSPYGPSGPSDVTSSGADSDTRALAATRFMRVNGPLSSSDGSSIRASTGAPVSSDGSRPSGGIDILQDQVANLRQEMEALREQRRVQDEDQLPAYSAIG